MFDKIRDNPDERWTVKTMIEKTNHQNNPVSGFNYSNQKKDGRNRSIREILKVFTHLGLLEKRKLLDKKIDERRKLRFETDYTPFGWSLKLSNF